MSRRVRVLMVEDDALDAELVFRHLKGNGFEIDLERVETEHELRRALEQSQPNVILSDFNMPRFDGLSALSLAREMTPQIPFIFVSGTIGEENAVQALRNGATDYVLKDKLARLAPAVERAIREAEEAASRKVLENRLHQAQKMEAIGQLTGGIAHDFNNLLTVILSNCDFLADLLPTGEAPNVLSEVIAAAERGAELTRQLLVFSRRQVLEPKHAKIAPLVEHAMRLLTRTLGEHVEISVSTAPDLWSVYIDPTQFETALTNLAVNARDAMPNGGTLAIKVANAPAIVSPFEGTAQDYVKVSVSDTGIGMPPEVIDRVFEPFFTTKDVGKGTGLGLSMVHGFVRQSGGHVEIDSTVGCGTTIRLYLPRTFQGADPISVSGGAETVLRARPGEIVLLVEDDTKIRAAVKRQLEQLGYRVIDAANGPAALEILLADGRIDLLFTDLVMPGGLNGVELYQRCREIRPRLPVLFTSGYSNPDQLDRIKDLSDWAILPKPYRNSILARKVREALDRIRPSSTKSL